MSVDTVEAVNYLVRALTSNGESGFITNAIDDAVFLFPNDDAYEIRIQMKRRVFKFKIDARELMLISSSSQQLDLVSNKLADAQARFRGDVIRDLLERPVDFAGAVDKQALFEQLERTGSKLLELASALRDEMAAPAAKAAR